MVAGHAYMDNCNHNDIMLEIPIKNTKETQNTVYNIEMSNSKIK